MRVVRAVAAGAIAAWTLLPESSKEAALEWVLNRTFGRADDARAQELAGCANYLEEVANQLERGGKKEVAEELRKAIKEMVAWRNSNP